MDSIIDGAHAVKLEPGLNDRSLQSPCMSHTISSTAPKRVMVEEFDGRIDLIVSGVRRQMVRDLFSGKLKPEEARDTLALLKASLRRGQWPTAAEDLDEIETGFGPYAAA